MAVYAWDQEKNDSLIAERGVSFERVILQIEGDGLLDIVSHPNTERFSHQKIFIIEIDEYVFLVPFVEYGEYIFLKIIIPSRKATKKYLGD